MIAIFKKEEVCIQYLIGKNALIFLQIVYFVADMFNRYDKQTTCTKRAVENEAMYKKNQYFLI